MSKRRKVKKHIKSLTEISDIMSSMKTLSMLEMRKVFRTMENQQRVVNNLKEMAQDFISYYDHSVAEPAINKTCLVVIGSERGFCGDFNDRLLATMEKHLTQMSNDKLALIGVGQKLNMKLNESQSALIRLDGANVIEESGPIIQRILETFQMLQQEQDFNSLRTIYFDSSSKQIEIITLWPPFSQLHSEAVSVSYPPLLHQAPEQFKLSLVEHYLLAMMHMIFYSSLLIENQLRIRHLEGALNQIDENLQSLSKRSSLLRQEEITEEIEIIILNAQSRLHSTNNIKKYLN